MMKLKKSIIALLLLMVTTISIGCGATTADTSAQGMTPEPTEVPLITADDIVAELEVSIPLFFSANCDHWVDQNGKIMTLADADTFFDHNPGIAYEIIYLNWNHLYATNLYNVERGEILWEKMDQYTASSRDELSNDILQRIYSDSLTSNRVDTELVKMLLSRLANNTVREDIRAMYDDSKNGASKDIDNGSIARRLFFAQLVNFMEDGRFEELCLNKEVERISIPILLDQNGVWYDQNNFPMADPEVEDFFLQHEGQAQRIVQFNFYSNPFLDAEALETETYEKLNAMIMPSSDTFGDTELCLEMLNHDTIYEVDGDTLVELACMLSMMQTDHYCRLHVMECMEELASYSTYQTDSIDTFGFYGESPDLIRYLFINALTKRAKNNAGPV